MCIALNELSAVVSHWAVAALQWVVSSAPGTTRPSQSQGAPSSVRGLSVKELKQRLRALGVSAVEIDDLDAVNDIKAAAIERLLAATLDAETPIK